ncbi:MAG: chemotaxis response regulator protein-glutamate methylesterase [Salinisphaeraceae bacterium]|nr:chemotaxis response regulator protein-glutamate methylesterase [Salinisphaeraceae bacterium]
MIRVLLIDDSALVRQLLSELLASDPEIEVVGTAPDPYVARQKIKALNPDVLTLDVEMPRMDGLTFLDNLMRLRPLPVIMVSSLTARGADATLRAMELGAIDFVTKPQVGVAEGLKAYGEELITKVKAAARARVRAREAPSPRTGRERLALEIRTTDQVLAIGASTGGTEAIREVLECLPPDCPPTVITQHIPAQFSDSFARRLDASSAMSVAEARDGLQLRHGHAYVAPGDQHLEVVRSGALYYTRLNRGEPVNRHRPSVDVLFNSVARACGRNAVGALLTGMGKDGAEGLLAMRQAGALTLAQDEKTSVVWGMPGAAVKIDAAQHVLPLNQIAPYLLRVRKAA